MANEIDYAAIAAAQTNDIELQKILSSGNSLATNEFKSFPVSQSGHTITCNVHQNKIRPYIPTAFREQIIANIHALSHPGKRATTKMVQERYFWPSMKKDCAQFVHKCLQCQRSKVNRHNKTILTQFTAPTERFQHVNIDIVGPLPTSRDSHASIDSPSGQLQFRYQTSQPKPLRAILFRAGYRSTECQSVSLPIWADSLNRIYSRS